MGVTASLSPSVAEEEIFLLLPHHITNPIQQRSYLKKTEKTPRQDKK